LDEFFSELFMHMCVVVDRVNLSVEAVVKQQTVNVVRVMLKFGI